jgi:hypothetical protein
MVDDNLVRIHEGYPTSDGKPREIATFYNPGVEDTVRRRLWEHDDRWSWLCKTASSGEAMLQLAKCHPDIATSAPWESIAIQMPEIWYEQWELLARGQDAPLNGLLEGLGETMALRVWDGCLGRLCECLEKLHDGCCQGELDDSPWDLLGADSISNAARDVLNGLDWLGKLLEAGAKQLHGDEEIAEMYERVQNMGDVGAKARTSLQEKANRKLDETTSDWEFLDAISESDYQAAVWLSDMLDIDYDFSAYRDRGP